MFRIVNIIFILFFNTVITYDTLKRVIILTQRALKIKKQFEVLRGTQASNNRILYNNALKLVFKEIRNYLVLQGVLIGAGFYNELWIK